MTLQLEREGRGADLLPNKYQAFLANAWSSSARPLPSGFSCSSDIYLADISWQIEPKFFFTLFCR